VDGPKKQDKLTANIDKSKSDSSFYFSCFIVLVTIDALLAWLFFS
jgi:hypothetical protein